MKQVIMCLTIIGIQLYLNVSDQLTSKGSFILQFSNICINVIPSFPSANRLSKSAAKANFSNDYEY